MRPASETITAQVNTAAMGAPPHSRSGESAGMHERLGPQACGRLADTSAALTWSLRHLAEEMGVILVERHTRSGTVLLTPMCGKSQTVASPKVIIDHPRMILMAHHIAPFALGIVAPLMLISWVLFH
jgi:hypothetical protein